MKKQLIKILLLSSLYIFTGMAYAHSQMIYADNELLFAGNSNNIWYSGDNGLNWSKSSINNPHYPIDFNGVAYNNGVFVAFGNAPEYLPPKASSYPTIWYSYNNGGSWSEGHGGGDPFDSNALEISPNRVYGVGNKLILLGNGGIPWYSADGINWHSEKANGNGTTDGVGIAMAVHDKTMVVVRNNKVSGYNEWDYSYSTDNGNTWNGNTLSGNATFTDVTYGDGKFVASASLGTLLYSTDGQNWVVGSGLDGEATFNRVIYDKPLKMFIAIADECTAAWSTDGKTWTLANIEGSHYDDLTTLAVGGNGEVVASSNSGYANGYQIVYTKDGKNWLNANATANADSIVWDPSVEKFYIADAQGTYENIISSSDGNAWVSVTKIPNT